MCLRARSFICSGLLLPPPPRWGFQTRGHSGAHLGCRGGVGALFPTCQVCQQLTTILGWAGGSREIGCGAGHVLLPQNFHCYTPNPHFSYLEPVIILSSLSQILKLPLSDSLNKDWISFQRGDLSLCNH